MFVSEQETYLVLIKLEGKGREGMEKKDFYLSIFVRTKVDKLDLDVGIS